jgi:hypothetical protein
MKAVFVILFGLLIFCGDAVAGTTITTARYLTDFATDRSGDFCDGAIAGSRYRSYSGAEGYSTHAEHAFAAGYMRIYARYGQSASQALIMGGSQLMDGGAPVYVTVGEDASGLITNQAYGVFEDVGVTLTYTLYQPTVDNHSEVEVKIGFHKKDGPYDWRKPTYVVVYDGSRLSIEEWTTSNDGGPYRELAGTDVSANSSSSTFKLVASVSGGDDNGGEVSGAEAAALTAILYENDSSRAELSTVDNPYDWGNGPELPGTVFDAGGDYGWGTWDPFEGDWTQGQAWARGARDLQTNGWVVIYAGQTGNNGTMQGIEAIGLDVNANYIAPGAEPEGTIISVR